MSLLYLFPQSLVFVNDDGRIGDVGYALAPPGPTPTSRSCQDELPWGRVGVLGGSRDLDSWLVSVIASSL